MSTRLSQEEKEFLAIARALFARDRWAIVNSDQWVVVESNLHDSILEHSNMTFVRWKSFLIEENEYGVVYRGNVYWLKDGSSQEVWW